MTVETHQASEPEGDVFPSFPPGFWRRIALHPRPGVVVAGLEDDVHRFALALAIAHRDGVITRVQTAAERAPWSTCPAAGGFIAGQLTGERLQSVAAHDPREHCTHLYDLAVLCAARAEDRHSTLFDMQVADRVDGRTSATLLEDGEPKLWWRVREGVIQEPGAWAGRSLRELSRWKAELSAEDALRAMLLRRAVFVSGARAQPQVIVGTAAERGQVRLGACYTYQMPHAAEAVHSAAWRRDFSLAGEPPLQGFDPDVLARRPAAEG
jgi:hypothetical protein